MRVLFASGIDGFCHRYAVLHWAEELATQAVASSIRAHTDPRLAADLATHDVFVLYRVPDGAWVRHLLARARALGRPTVFAVDDLIFEPALADPPPVRRMSAAERGLWQDGVERYRRTLLACDAFLTTTAPLAAAGRDLGRPTYLHRCGLAARELALGAAARRVRDEGDHRTAEAPGVRLGYFSGTATHDEDFASIAPVLCTLLARHSSLTLAVTGPVTLEPALAAYAARIERAPLVSWPALSARVAAVDANLAPLVWHDPFVAGKGAVKYLEAAVVEVPTIASPTEAFRYAVADGVTGLLATDAACWESALTSLIEDPVRRRRLGAAARADVVARFASAPQGAALRAILEDVAAAGARPLANGARVDDAHDCSIAAEVALARRFPAEVARAAREPNAFPDLALPVTETTELLGDGVMLTQRFHVGRPGLMRVDVYTVTGGAALDHDLELRLRRPDGSLAATTRIPAALAPDREWLALDVPLEPDSAGRVYVLELCSHGARTGNALWFGATTVPHEDGPYRLGDVAGMGSLALRTFAADVTGGRCE